MAGQLALAPSGRCLDLEFASPAQIPEQRKPDSRIHGPEVRIADEGHVQTHGYLSIRAAK
jgi:hypothetical protein